REPGQNSPAGGINQGREGAVESRLIVHHVGKYCTCKRECQPGDVPAGTRSKPRTRHKDLFFVVGSLEPNDIRRREARRAAAMSARPSMADADPVLQLRTRHARAVICSPGNRSCQSDSCTETHPAERRS